MNKARTLAVAIALATGAAGTLGVSAAHAADKYPSKAIRVIVPFAPGGSTDIIARLVTQRMSQELGQPMVVENKGGAGGAIGASEAARAEPDGYAVDRHRVDHGSEPGLPSERPALRSDQGLPAGHQLRQHGQRGRRESEVPGQGLQGLPGRAEEEPRKYSYGSSGTCGVLHLMGESFKMATGTDIVHVPYRGSGPAVADAVGGQIEIIFDNLPSSMPQIQAGKLRAMAIAWPGNIDAIRTCRPSRTPASRC